MSEENNIHAGRCLCGAVRFEATGKPLCVAHCHCETCRRHTGAPVVTFVAFDGANVSFPDRERSIYNSSPAVKRAFCDQCGTPLTWEGHYKGVDIIEFYISTMDDPDQYVPEWHWHHSERISWFDVADGLKRYRHSDGPDDEPYRHGPVSEGLPE